MTSTFAGRSFAPTSRLGTTADRAVPPKRRARPRPDSGRRGKLPVVAAGRAGVGEVATDDAGHDAGGRERQREVDVAGGSCRRVGTECRGRDAELQLLDPI